MSTSQFKSSLIVFVVVISVTLLSFTTFNKVFSQGLIASANDQTGAIEQAGSSSSPQYTSDKIRVIVELKISDIQNSEWNSVLSAESRSPNSMTTYAQQILETLSADASVYAYFENLPIMGLELKQNDLPLVMQNNLVAAIHSDTLSKPLLDTSTTLIGMPAVWNIGYEGNGQTVVILDSGIVRNHPFFNGRVIDEACFSNANNSGHGTSLCPNEQGSQLGIGAADALTQGCEEGIENLCWHGTHVAGISAGNGDAFDGVARRSNIIMIQVFTRFDRDEDCAPERAPCIRAYVSDQIRALEYVASELSQEHEIASVNMSIGGGGPFTVACDDDPMKLVIDALLSLRIPTVIASGNDGFQNGVASPACISTAITVGSSTDADTISSFSNMGSLVDLVAPGSLIQSSIIGGNQYGFASGTSMAAPHVTGAWAIFREQNPNLSVSEVLSVLQRNGQPISHPTYPRNRISVDRSLAKVSSLSECPSCFLGVGSWTGAGLFSHGWFTGDFNGDGKDDVFRYNEQTGSGADMFLSDGTKFISSGSWTGAGLTSSHGWFVGDFNGDGKDDIFRYNEPSQSGADVYLSDGSKFISAGSWTGAGLTSSHGWFVGDFNGDGKDDIFRYNEPSQSGADVYLSDGSKFISAGSWTGAGLKSVLGWSIGDFNGDGKDDIFRYYPGTSGADMFLSDGTKFVHTSSWTGAGLYSRKWHVGDFNGDGKDDIFRYVSGQSGADVFLSTGTQFTRSGSWTGAGLKTSHNWFVGDFNGDGSSDIFRYAPGEAGADMFLSQRVQSKLVTCPHCFSNFGNWHKTDMGQRNWRVGDFNGDNKSDILRYDEQRGSGADVFLSDGTKFIANGSWTGAGLSFASWFVGDFNGDGKDDIFRYIPGTSGADMFLSDGSKFMRDSSWTEAGLTSSHGWFVGDFNGDGKDDIFRYNEPNGIGADMFLSDGTKFIHNGSWTGFGLPSSHGWFVGDFNGDGKDDIFRYYPGKSGADMFLSDGTKFVHNGSWTGAGLLSTGWFVGDFNGDNKDDIFRYYPGKSGADMFLSTGTKFVYDSSWTDAEAYNSIWFIGDYNGDKASDLMRHNSAQLDNEVWLSLVKSVTPPAPILLGLSTDAEGVGSTAPFSWHPVTNTILYNLQVDTELTFEVLEVNVETIGFEYSPESKLPDNLYYWRVRGQDAAGIRGEWSEVKQLVIDTVAPAPPTLADLEKVLISNSSHFTLTWTPYENNLTFQLQLDNTNRFENLLMNLTTIDTTVRSNMQLTAGTYFWKVRSRDESGNWGDWSVTDQFTVKPEPLNELFLPIIQNQ